ncbi:methyl-accepting chemotaxis protein [Neiella sp. HB171785]|uniref:Methyl-accepting chemotaxis protein n=2 Tax=Neiella litorisoli TaxID=2771431 RepID=A0A8J6UPX8_9GAMM|nr:methyl-accepting chemotaxis protein [Neiella litorisoli]
MGWLHNLRFMAKQMLIAAIFGTAIVVLIVVSLSATRQLGNDTSTFSDSFLPRVNFLLQADRDLYQSILAERTLISIDSSHPDYAALVTQHQENIQQAADRVKSAQALATDSAQLRMYNDFQSELSRWQTVSNNVLSTAADSKQRAATMSVGQSTEQFERARDLIDKLTELTEQEAAASIKHSREIRENVTWTIWSVAIIGIVVAFSIAYVTAIYSTNVIHDVRDRIRDIAEGEGDLTQRIKVQGKDEIGELCVAFNSFVENQAGIIGHIKGAMSGLNNELGKATRQITKAQQATSNQQAENDQIATAVTEMAATVQEVARNASDAASATHKADTDVDNGRAVVNKTVESIEDLVSDIEKSAQVIQRVETGSHEIGTVMDVISSIAEQTNLLALNAAIEAARAGEQGRGFAVVADEVRTLAQRTQESTSSIRDIIERLQSESAAAVEAMKASQNGTQQVVELAAQTGDVLEQISVAVKSIADMNTQIAAASEEQSSTADQISENGVRIKQIAEETYQITLDVTSANERVGSHTNEVAQLVGRFKI